MQIGNSIRKGTAWLFTGSISLKILEFLFGVALARLLVPDDFGLLVTVQVFTGAASFIAGGGMGQALIQATEVNKRHYQVVFTLQLLICSFIYAFFFHISPWFALWFNTPIYTDLLRLSALTFLIRPFANIARAKLKREMRFKPIVIVSIIAKIIGSSLSIYLAFHNYGVWSLIFGGLTATVFTTTCLILISKCYPAICYENSIAKTLGSYGIKFSINDIIHYLRDQAPNFLIGKFMGANTVGLFNKGRSLSSLPVETIGGSAYQTVFRALSSTQDNLDQSKYIYLRTITLISTYTIPFYIGLFWLAESFIVTVYTEKWILASVPLQILAIQGILRCISNPSGAVLAAQNRLGTEILIQIITFLLGVAGCIYGIQHNSLFYISIGLIPGSIFFSASMSFFALRIVNASYRDLIIALKPAIILNSLLALTLAASDKLLYLYAYELASSHLTYLAIQSAIGGSLYICLFLFLPIKSLKKEASRYKKFLRLQSSVIQERN